MIFGLLAECLLIVAFPVAPLWWIRRQTRLDQELLADALTVERLGAATEYAAELVAIAGTGTATPTIAARSVGSIAPETDGSDLYWRVLVLLRSPQPILTRPSLGRLAGMTAAIAVAVLAAGILDFRPGPLRAAAISPARHAAFRVRLVAVDGSSSVELPAPSFTAFRARGRILGRRDAIAHWEFLGLRPRLAFGTDPTLNPFREVVDLAFEFESRPGRRRLRVERCPWVELSGFAEPPRFVLRNQGSDSLVIHSMSISALTAE
jgi:hypothetical protein